MTTEIAHHSDRSPYEIELEGPIVEFGDEDQFVVSEPGQQFSFEHHSGLGFPEVWMLGHETDVLYVDAFEAYRVGWHTDRIVLLPNPWREPESTTSEQDSDHLSETGRRLDRANRHFRRKAGAVFNDANALDLLTRMNTQILVETSDFDFCNDGRSLAKLTAANFCDVGANGIFITDRGRRFIAKLYAA